MLRVVKINHFLIKFPLYFRNLPNLTTLSLPKDLLFPPLIWQSCVHQSIEQSVFRWTRKLWTRHCSILSTIRNVWISVNCALQKESSAGYFIAIWCAWMMMVQPLMSLPLLSLRLWNLCFYRKLFMTPTQKKSKSKTS